MTGEPQSKIVLIGSAFTLPNIVNCPFSSSSKINPIFSSSIVESLLLSSHSSFLSFCCCGGLNTFRLSAKFPTPLIWQHFAKRPFFPHYMKVIPIALHSFRCYGVNIASHLKHFLLGFFSHFSAPLWLIVFISLTPSLRLSLRLAVRLSVVLQHLFRMRSQIALFLLLMLWGQFTVFVEHLCLPCLQWRRLSLNFRNSSKAPFVS